MSGRNQQRYYHHQQQQQCGASGTNTGVSGDGEVLISNERLSCDSPVMWPDQNFFGDFNPLHLSPAPPKWLLEINKDDRRMINEFGSLTQAQLMEKVRALQNMAYQLGVEEAKEMSRGKCLDVFLLPDSTGGKGEKHH